MRVNEINEPRVLPWVFWLVVEPFLPFAFVLVAKLLALRQAPPRLAHDVLDWLAIFPPDPHGGGSHCDELGAVLDRGGLLSGAPAPVRELEQSAADRALSGFGRRFVQPSPAGTVKALFCSRFCISVWRSLIAFSPVAPGSLVCSRVTAVMRAARLATSWRSPVNAVAIWLETSGRSSPHAVS